ncbi:hypothetical protein CMI38_05160 [Candidatus Pacearchaeota archaeon]|jgi:uncharacterized membrane protein|nr:hypothetical protein [Candidatus Pacearchaeota archaeon]|tara:strand:- start:832 stop:1332 length:501 start_codon:yes stop_codon:yes gene_type:complete
MPRKNANQKKLIIKNNSITTDLKKTEKKVEKITSKLTKGIKIPFQDKRKLTIGQKTSDGLAKWAGSWTFILGFIAILILWIIVNTYYWSKYQSGQPFDPYPFILLNLVLSCLAALQAPVILMSQNRAAERDRLRAEYDYKVNRVAEKEIREMKKQLNRIERKFNKR